MSFLIDTNLISRFHKNSVPLKLEHWLEKNTADCFISSVTIAEMRFGVENADESHREILEARVAQTENDFAEAIEPVDLRCLVQWKKVGAFLKKNRRTISCEDSLLAAQCLSNGHVMATENVKDFEILKPMGLMVENPLG